jgi:hypothetical protein
MFLILVAHPCLNVKDEILEYLRETSQSIHWMSYWNPDTMKMIRDKALLWSKQKTTQGVALVIDCAENFSNHGFFSIIGLMEQGFARDLVLIVSSIHRVPEHILERGTIVYSSQKPEFIEGWKNDDPDILDRNGWEEVLRS